MRVQAVAAAGLIFSHPAVRQYYTAFSPSGRLRLNFKAGVCAGRSARQEAYCWLPGAPKVHEKLQTGTVKGGFIIT